MPQVKIYGLAETLATRRKPLSDAIHDCVMEVLGVPAEKKAQRFFPLAREDFVMPEGRSDDYIIIEVLMIGGRTIDTRKRLVRTLFDHVSKKLDISVVDIEVTLIESPAENWGFRGIHGDEAKLTYNVKA